MLQVLQPWTESLSKLQVEVSRMAVCVSGILHALVGITECSLL
jgi:hypothetical protein